MKQEGIHPRVFYPNGVKKNTSKPRSKARLERQMRGIEKHLENHPTDAVSAQRVSKIKTILAG